MANISYKRIIENFCGGSYDIFLLNYKKQYSYIIASGIDQAFLIIDNNALENIINEYYDFFPITEKFEVSEKYFLKLTPVEITKAILKVTQKAEYKFSLIDSDNRSYAIEMSKLLERFKYHVDNLTRKDFTVSEILDNLIEKEYLND